jgi:hypothetical protein
VGGYKTWFVGLLIAAQQKLEQRVTETMLNLNLKALVFFFANRFDLALLILSAFHRKIYLCSKKIISLTSCNQFICSSYKEQALKLVNLYDSFLGKPVSKRLEIKFSTIKAHNTHYEKIWNKKVALSWQRYNFRLSKTGRGNRSKQSN